MPPPEVVIINSTAARVIWTSPSSPNGVVTEYSVCVNKRLHKTGMDVPGSLLLPDLSPFTVYDIQVSTLLFNLYAHGSVKENMPGCVSKCLPSILVTGDVFGGEGERKEGS